MKIQTGLYIHRKGTDWFWEYHGLARCCHEYDSPQHMAGDLFTLVNVFNATAFLVKHDRDDTETHAQREAEYEKFVALFKMFCKRKRIPWAGKVRT